MTNDSSAVASALSSLSSTVFNCRLESSAGFYDVANVIVFFSDRINELLTEVVFADWHVRRHNKVIVAQVNESREVLQLSRYDHGRGERGVFKTFKSPVILQHLSDLLPKQSMRRVTLRIGYSPYITYLIGEVDSEPRSPHRLYKNLVGFEVSMAKAVAGALGCSYEFR